MTEVPLIKSQNFKTVSKTPRKCHNYKAQPSQSTKRTDEEQTMTNKCHISNHQGLGLVKVWNQSQSNQYAQGRTLCMHNFLRTVCHKCHFIPVLCLRVLKPISLESDQNLALWHEIILTVIMGHNFINNYPNLSINNIMQPLLKTMWP